MTKGLTDFFNLPSLDEVLAETTPEGEEIVDAVTEEEPEEEPQIPAIVSGTSTELITHDDLKSDTHSRDMDKIHDLMMKHGNDITELAYDLDPARAPRMLEVAEKYFHTALDAKNSKRDAQLKLMKLIQDQRKLDLEEARVRNELGGVQSDRADVIMVEDRNALLKRLRDEASAPDPK